MTISTLASALDETKLEFAHFGWSSAPSGDYGVYAEDSNPQFGADDKYAENSVHGYVNYFTRDDSETAKNTIENAFKTLQATYAFAWNLNSISYEENTHFVHYEWEVEFA